MEKVVSIACQTETYLEAARRHVKARRYPVNTSVSLRINQTKFAC